MSAVTTLALATLATSATAHDLGLRVTYRPATGQYCILPHREDATLTSGVRLYRTQCQTRANWARQGIKIEHPLPIVAAVDGHRG